MLYFQGWKLALILGVCLLGLIFALPNAFAPTTIASWPGFLQRQVSLGLDLRGGSYLLLQVDMGAVQRERLNNVVDELRTQLIAGKIGYKDLAATTDHVGVTLLDPARMQDLRTILTKIDPGMDVRTGDNGGVTITPNQVDLTAQQSAVVSQSIEIVRRRIDETGTREASIQREGVDRIVVQLPGVENPEHVKELLGQTAKMTFQLVDMNASPQDARSGKLPPGDEVLPGEATQNGQPSQYYVVRRRVMVSGDTLTDAQATFQNSQPVVSFKFDSIGARRFADATRENAPARRRKKTASTPTAGPVPAAPAA